MVLLEVNIVSSAMEGPCRAVHRSTVEEPKESAGGNSLSIYLWLAVLWLDVNHQQSESCVICVQDFYEDIFEEVDKFGEIEHLNICDNLADHMVGNVYIKFK